MKSSFRGENELLVRLSKTLTSVSSASRKKGLDIITRYISKHSNSITRLQIIKIWKGLYYSMWLSDKVLIQREMAVNISQLQRKFEINECLLSFIEEFYLMMRFRWDGLDHYRMDKFTFLQRTMLAESLDILAKKNFDSEFACGLFDVYCRSLFTDSVDNDKFMSKKRKYLFMDNSTESGNEMDSSNMLSISKLTGIGVPLIFCKQFPQEFVYVLYEQFKLQGDKLSNSNFTKEHITSLFNSYSVFITNIIESCSSHSTLVECIYSQLILKLLDYDILLDQVLSDIEDLSIDQEERNIISEFLSENIVNLMLILQSSLKTLSKLNSDSISQNKRNNIYLTLDKIDLFLKNSSFNSLPKVSKNKKSIASKETIKCTGGKEDMEKKVRFDMSKNVRMLLPDSISTSKALVKIFDKKRKLKDNNQLNCILFRSSSNSEYNNTSISSEPDSIQNGGMESLKNIEIVSAEEALSKPTVPNSSPSKSILKIK
ncbi:RRp1-like protein [Cryptosporidium canis]|uniref:RRp1-like protein n=1 Tax=Cryptosporidium canis TaxID=195482 RepID=A0A9D5HVC8_9CRYT|nr:RRp1-like protein [Cryptosporidium canis]